MKRIIFPVLAIGILASGPAVAAEVTYTGTTYRLPTPSGVQAYLKTAPSSGTVTFVGNVQDVIITTGTTISALTIALNANPYDGQVNCFYSKPAITTLTLSKASTQTLNDAVTAATATTRYCYQFSSSNQSWDRSQ